MALAKKLKQQGIDVIHLEIGDPDFDSSPKVVEATCDALRSGHTHYAISVGMEEFRLAAAKVSIWSRGFLPTIDQILFTPGGNIKVYLAIACTVKLRKELIITGRCFVS